MGPFVMPALPADLAEIIDTHRRLFGGFVMETTDPPPADTPPADPPAPPANEPPATGDDELGEAGKKALAAERKAARDALARANAAEARLQAIEDAGKSELQRATDAAAKAQREAEQTRQELARERVARKHGLADEDLELLSGDEEQMERLAARLATAATPPAGDDGAPGGAPKAPTVPGIGRQPDTRNIPLVDQIAAAEKDGNKALVMTLKAMQLSAAANK